MCMEDILLGREQMSNIRRNTAGVAATEYIGIDLKRTVLILVPPTVGNLTYSLEKPTAIGDGINLVPQSSALILNIKDHGELVTRGWFMLSDQASQVNQALWSILPREK